MTSTCRPRPAARRRPNERGGRARSPRRAILGAGLLAACLSTSSGGARSEDTDRSRPGDAGKPTEVRVRIYLLDVVDISGGDQSFGADVVIGAEWEDPRLAGLGEGARDVSMATVWHPRLQCVNQRSIRSVLPEVVEVRTSGLVVYRQRWSGRFSAAMDLRSFPLDTQSFDVQVVAVGYRPEEVRLVPSTFPEAPVASERLSISDWSLDSVRVDEANYSVAPGGQSLAGARLTFVGKRRLSYYGVQIVLPLAMIVLMAWSALWIDPTVVNTRVSVVVTTMLTLIAYRFALGNLVPKLPYLTRLDYFLLGSTTLVFATLLYMAGASFLTARKRLDLVLRIDVRARILFPAAFALLFAAVCLVPG